MTNFEIAMLLALIGYGIIFGIICAGLFSRTRRNKSSIKITNKILDCHNVRIEGIIDRMDFIVQIIDKQFKELKMKVEPQESKEEQKPDWMYGIFDRDKIKTYKEHGMTVEEKQKFKEYMKDYTKAQIIGWMSAMSFILLMDETTKKLRDELFDMLNICIDVIKEKRYDKGCKVKAENDDMEAMLEHLWNDTADEESDD